MDLEYRTSITRDPETGEFKLTTRAEGQDQESFKTYQELSNDVGTNRFWSVAASRLIFVIGYGSALWQAVPDVWRLTQTSSLDGTDFGRAILIAALTYGIWKLEAFEVSKYQSQAKAVAEYTEQSAQTFSKIKVV